LAVTSATPTNLVVGAGDVTVDAGVLGASIGDNTFRIERDYFTPDLNGTKGALKGTTYINRSEAVLEATIPEISASIFADLWPASTSAGGVIDEDETRRIPSASFHDWKLTVERLGGGSFNFEADDALNLANLEMTLGDAAVAGPRVEAHSFWDAADLTTSPHRIRVLSS
jgi:hypothetical protein